MIVKPALLLIGWEPYGAVAAGMEKHMKDEDPKSPEIQAWEMPPPKRRDGGADTDTATTLDSIIRQSYREPVKNEPLTVSVNGTAYGIADIGSRGIGVYLDRPDELAPGGNYPVTIELQGQTLQLLGRVIHVSPDPIEKYLCGIELTNLGPTEEKSLQEFLQRMHDLFFANK
jgi:hypothetical protein